MENRLVNTSARILSLFFIKYSTRDCKENLTSGQLISDCLLNSIHDISLGTNEIINEIGKDRSHISKSIKFMKDLQLLCEHGKWEEGKRKDTRLTELGVAVGSIAYHSERHKNAILTISKELKETINLLPKLYFSKRSSKLIIKSNFAENFFISDIDKDIVTCRDALSSIKNFAETWPSDIMGKYWEITAQFKLDNKKRHFVDMVLMNTIYTYMQDISREINEFTSWMEGQKDSLGLNGKVIHLETTHDYIYYRISIKRGFMGFTG